MRETVQCDPDQIADLLSAINDAHKEIDRQERLRIAAEESRTRAPFKVGGYEMSNRHGRWEAIQRSSAPAWIKVAEYCATHHRKDGHCPMGDDFGELVLGKSIKRQYRDELVARAVTEGLLAEGSNGRCLVAPWWLRYMTTGDVWSDCSLHDRK